MKQSAGISLSIMNVRRVLVNYSVPSLCQNRIWLFGVFAMGRLSVYIRFIYMPLYKLQ